MVQVFDKKTHRGPKETKEPWTFVILTSFAPITDMHFSIYKHLEIMSRTCCYLCNNTSILRTTNLSGSTLIIHNKKVCIE